MKVKELVELLDRNEDNAEVMIAGCYGSTGWIEKVAWVDGTVYIYSDICSG